MTLFTESLTVNPFSGEYYQREVEAFQVKEGTFKNLSIKHKDMSGRINGFLHKDFRVLKDVPVFFIDNEVWMSLTPMEVQSHYLPILLAEGKVGVAGLGYGYYLQRILNKEEVDEVIVYEINPDVINFYLQNFGEHPKLTIKQQDVRTLKDEYFTFFYCDIYKYQLDTKAIEDMAYITTYNHIDQYHFWTQEGVILEILLSGNNHEIPYSWQMTYFPFIQSLLDEKESFLNSLGCGEQFLEELREYNVI